MKLAQQAAVVAVACPSALEVWAERAGTNAWAACIGTTSGGRAKKMRFKGVVCAASPAVNDWAKAILEAVRASDPGGID